MIWNVHSFFELNTVLEFYSFTVLDLNMGSACQIVIKITVITPKMKIKWIN